MNGSILSFAWSVPFVGLLLSIALGPLLFPKIWHSHYGKISLFWILATIFPMMHSFGLSVTLHEAGHTYGEHFLPFIILLVTLYVLSGGIKLTVLGMPTPMVNMVFLAFACVASNFLGTVGSAMIFIRPFLELNQGRQYKTHSLVFFIFLVCNIGGSLTAIGDPPLFIGFLLGVDFFWPLIHLIKPFMMMVVPLLGMYYVLDSYYMRKEKPLKPHRFSVSFKGWCHVGLLGVALTLIIVSGLWQNAPSLSLVLFETTLSNLVRDFGLICVTALSYFLQRHESVQKTLFEWGPMVEVFKLFAGIFMTAAPVIAMLKVGKEGAFAPLIELVTRPNGAPISGAYFWLSGALSAFLDNAPTYLIFFNLLGAPVEQMMTIHAQTLMAISMGSVFMGAVSYIGNAPNFMVKAIAETHHIAMPSFFVYILWSVVCLLPLFALISFSFF